MREHDSIAGSDLMAQTTEEKRGETRLTLSQTTIKFQNPTKLTWAGVMPFHQPFPESLSATTYIVCRTSSIVTQHARNRTAYATSASGVVSSLTTAAAAAATTGSTLASAFSSSSAAAVVVPFACEVAADAGAGGASCATKEG